MKTTIFIFLTILFLAYFPGSVSAQTGSVFFLPDTTILAPNDSAQIDIMVDANLIGIHCFRVTIGFDTSLIELVDVTEGSLMPDVGQTFFFWSPTDEGYDIGSCLLGFGLYANGPGVLATMKFRAGSDTGTTSLHFTDQEFIDTLSNHIAVLTLYGAIVVYDSLPQDINDPAPGAGLPYDFLLSQNYPNPFNSTTSIQYSIGEPRFITIEIYDIMGRLQDILVSGIMPAGNHNITWDAGGSASGIYYYRLNSDGRSTTRKMLLLR